MKKDSKIPMTTLHLVECQTFFYPDRGAVLTIQRLIDGEKQYTTEEWSPLSEDDVKKLSFELPDVIVKQKFKRVIPKSL